MIDSRLSLHVKEYVMVNCLQALRHLRVGFREYPEDMESLLKEENERN